MGGTDGLKADKGLRNGSCNRTACQVSGATYLNSGTHAYYCRACARLINRNCPADQPLCVIDPELAAQQSQQRLNAVLDPGDRGDAGVGGRPLRPMRL